MDDTNGIGVMRGGDSGIPDGRDSNHENFRFDDRKIKHEGRRINNGGNR